MQICPWLWRRRGLRVGGSRGRSGLSREGCGCSCLLRRSSVCAGWGEQESPQTCLGEPAAPAETRDGTAPSARAVPTPTPTPSPPSTPPPHTAVCCRGPEACTWSPSQGPPALQLGLLCLHLLPCGVLSGAPVSTGACLGKSVQCGPSAGLAERCQTSSFLLGDRSGLVSQSW